MECLLVGSDKIAYRQIGDVKSTYTFILIHGAGMTGESMVPLTENFLSYNCIVIDLPGHGSSLGDTKTSIEEFADSLDLFIQEMLRKQLISNHITLIGYSLGGGISFELALKKREEYKRLIILSSGANISGNAPLMQSIKQQPKENFKFEAIFDYVFGKSTTLAQKKFFINIVKNIKVDDVVAYSDLLCATTYNKEEKASEVLIPTFIFAGDEDQVILPSCEIGLWKNMKNATIAIIPSRGHAAMFEKTKYLVSLIKDFCRQNK